MALLKTATLYRGLAWVALGLPLLISSGCATLNENECRLSDWQTIGYEDGGRGYAVERIGQHRKACAKFGIAPDLTAYQRGRDAGLREFCRPASGFKYGANGNSYTGVCPAELEDDFLDGYESGQQLYELRARVSNIESEISSKRSEIERTQARVAHASASVVGDVTPEQRAQAVLEVQRLAGDVGRLKAELESLDAERCQYERELEDFRATLRFAE